MTTQYPDFKEVTKEEFFAIMGNRNAHPTPGGKWNNETGYLTEWRSLTSGHIYGLSNKNAYFLHL